MKNYYFVILIFTLFSQISSAQEWVRQNPFPVLSELNDVYVDVEDFGWAVGSDNTILNTTNGGDVWNILDPGVDDWSFSAIGYIPGSQGQKVFVGGDKGLLNSIDGGATWTELQIDLEEVDKILVIDASTILALNADHFARSLDGGSTWEVLDGLDDDHDEVTFVDTEFGWMTSDDVPGVFKTTDGGVSWNSVSENLDIPTNQIHALRFKDRDTGYFYHDEDIYQTVDGGANWETIADIRFSQDWTDLVIADDQMYAGSRLGVIYYSYDAGLSWTQADNGNHPAKDLNAMHLRSDGELWSVGRYTTIMHSDDNGQIWKDQIVGSKSFFGEINMYDADFGVAIAQSNEILLTSDGGAIWEKIIVNENARSFWSSLIVNPNEIWLTGTNGIWVTYDRGVTWELNIEIPQANTSIVQLSADVFVLSNAGQDIYRSTDHGANWDLVFENSSNGSFGNLHFIDDLTGWGVGYGSFIVKTTDGGLSWTIQNAPGEGNEAFQDIFFISELEGWLISRKIFHTVDGGLNWDEQSIPGIIPNSLYFEDAERGYFTGGVFNGAGYLYRTLDGGDTWDRFQDFKTLTSGLAIDADSEQMWITGQGGNIEVFAGCGATPIIDNLTGPTIACIGDTVTYRVESDNVVLFDWVLPDGWTLLGNSNSGQIDVLPGVADGEISIMGSNTCEPSNSLMMNVSSMENLAEVDIELVENELRTSSIADQYQWYFNNQPITDATQSTWLPIETGDYYVRAQLNPCSEVQSAVLNVVISASSNLDQSKWALAPNPADNFVWIRSDATVSNSVVIKLYSSLGKLELEYVIYESTRIDLSNLKADIYFLQLIDGEETYYSKVVLN